VVDKDLRIQLFNDKFVAWNKELGLATKAIGKSIFQVFPFLPEQVKKEYRRVFATGKTLVTEEHTKIRGQDFVTETRKIPVWEGEKVGKVITAVRDVTERKKIEQTKTNLVRDITHGLKTPIAIAEMGLNLYKKGIRSNNWSQIEKAQRIVGHNVDKLKKDVDNIVEAFALDIRKAEKRKPPKKQTAVRRILSLILQDYHDLAEQKNIKIKALVSKRVKTVKMEKRDFRLLLSNVIDNAVKFTEKGKIKISIKKKSSQVIIVVKDTGIGLEQENEMKVFDRFYKRYSSQDGSGLGLSICKEIVDIYHGSIKIKSRGIGRGTTVTLMLTS